MFGYIGIMPAAASSHLVDPRERDNVKYRLCQKDDVGNGQERVCSTQGFRFSDPNESSCEEHKTRKDNHGIGCRQELALGRIDLE